jgi:PAS domain S-box-containing protein
LPQLHIQMVADKPASEKHDLLASLIAQLNDFVVVICDAGGVIRSWHEGIRSQLGYSAADFVGRPLAELFRMEPNAGGQKPDTEVFSIANKVGEPVIVSAVTIAMEPLFGDSKGFVKVIRGLTSVNDTASASRALLEALEHSNVLIRRWDGVIEHWSDGCERLYGYSAAEAVGRNVHELLQTVYPVPLDQMQVQLKQTGSWLGELKQVSKYGATVYVSAQLVLLGKRHDSEPLIVSTHSDISAQLQMRQDLVSANARLKSMAIELERSNQELEEFARIASHDLSAPITTTGWLVDLLTSRHGHSLNEEGKSCLKQISLSLARMSDLVEAVLQHAKVGTSAIGASEEADTELALEAALENLRRDIETSGARISYLRLPPLLIGQQPLTQLFQNLLSNAIKYRSPGVAPAISIRAEWTEGLWQIAVSDNGIGVEPQWRERIFQPMQRLHGSEIAGSGIGLATCRKIVDRAGGRIWVEPNNGAGSTFYFVLPSLSMEEVPLPIATEKST